MSGRYCSCCPRAATRPARVALQLTAPPGGRNMCFSARELPYPPAVVRPCWAVGSTPAVGPAHQFGGPSCAGHTFPGHQAALAEAPRLWLVYVWPPASAHATASCPVTGETCCFNKSSPCWPRLLVRPHWLLACEGLFPQGTYWAARLSVAPAATGQHPGDLLALTPHSAGLPLPGVGSDHDGCPPTAVPVGNTPALCTEMGPVSLLPEARMH